MTRLRRYLTAPVNAGKEPRWLVAVGRVLAVPCGPIVRRIFADATRGGWAH